MVASVGTLELLTNL